MSLLCLDDMQMYLSDLVLLIACCCTNREKHRTAPISPVLFKNLNSCTFYQKLQKNVNKEWSNTTNTTICIWNMPEKTKIDETCFSWMKKNWENIKSQSHAGMFIKEIPYSAHSASSGSSFRSLRAFPTNPACSSFPIVTSEREHLIKYRDYCAKGCRLQKTAKQINNYRS